MLYHLPKRSGRFIKVYQLLKKVVLLKRLLETGFSNKILSFQKMLQTVQSAVDEILKAFYDNGWVISITDAENAKKVEVLDE